VESIAVDPTNPDVVFAGASTVVKGSPADEFISDPEAIGAHHGEGDRA
jgi:hypothetical protein